jgi:hypothetical protein
MLARYPSEWEELFDILQSWLYDNNSSVLLDTTGNTGGLLSILENKAPTDEVTTISLQDRATESTDFPDFSSIEDEIPQQYESIPPADYLRSLTESKEGSECNTSTSWLPDGPFADVVCCFETNGRRQYTEDSIEEHLEHLVGKTGHPKYERVLSAVSALREGGRGIFLLPRSMLYSYNPVFDYFQDVRVHAILELDAERFGFEEIDPRFKISAILVENRPIGDDPVRYISIDQFDERVGPLIHCPPSHLQGVDLTEHPLEMATFGQRDLLDFPPQVALNVPHLFPIFRSDEFVPLGEINEVTIQRGPHEPLPESFYFKPEGIEKSGIDSDRFTTIITRDEIIETAHSIGESSIQQFVLDLREPIHAIKDRPNHSKDEILDELRDSGYEQAVDYVTSNIPDWTPATGYWFCPFLHQAEDNFALVAPELSPDAEWTHVDIDSAILDRYCLGIVCKDQNVERGVTQMMQTRGYQRLIEGLFDSSFGGVIQYHLYLINQIPIPRYVLTEDFGTQTESSLPPESYQDKVRLIEYLSECIDEAEARDTFERLLEPDDEYAWAWFLSPSEYQEFTDKWESDPEAAKQFVADHLTEENIRQIERDLTRDILPRERSQIVGELLNEYRNRKNRLFLYGVTPQFEGVLVDWAKQNGHRVEEDDEENIIVSIDPYDKAGQTVPKTLSGLLKYYLQDGFGEFLHEHVRTRRNEVAHGAIVEDDRDQATMFLLCLYALYRKTLLTVESPE